MSAEAGKSLFAEGMRPIEGRRSRAGVTGWPAVIYLGVRISMAYRRKDIAKVHKYVRKLLAHDWFLAQINAMDLPEIILQCATTEEAEHALRTRLTRSMPAAAPSNDGSVQVFLPSVEAAECHLVTQHGFTESKLQYYAGVKMPHVVKAGDKLLAFVELRSLVGDSPLPPGQIGNNDDRADTDIGFKCSSDGGATWSALRLLYRKVEAGADAHAELSWCKTMHHRCGGHRLGLKSSCSDVLAGYDGARIVVVFVYEHRRVFTCKSTPMCAVESADEVEFSVPQEITLQVHPHWLDPFTFTESYINVGHTTSVRIRDAYGGQKLLFPMSLGGSGTSRGPFLAVHHIGGRAQNDVGGNHADADGKADSGGVGTAAVVTSVFFEGEEVRLAFREGAPLEAKYGYRHNNVDDVVDVTSILLRHSLREDIPSAGGSNSSTGGVLRCHLGAVSMLHEEIGDPSFGNVKKLVVRYVPVDSPENPPDHSRHESSWSVQALEMLQRARDIIEPAIAALGDPDAGECAILMNCRNTTPVGLSFMRRFRAEAVGRAWDDWHDALNSSSLSARSNGGFQVTNLVDPLLTGGATTALLRLSRTGRILYAGISHRYFRKGLTLYERVVVGQSAAGRMLGLRSKVQHVPLLEVTAKTVMTPSMVELQADAHMDGARGAWVGLLYERGGRSSEYPLGGIVFQATEVVFERHFIAD